MRYQPRHAKPSQLSRKLTGLSVGIGVAASLFAQPAMAEAQQMPAMSSNGGLGALLEQTQSQLSSIGSSTPDARERAWQTRNSLRAQADGLAAINKDLPAQAKASIDATVERFYPGLIAEKTPKPPAPKPVAPLAPPAQPAFNYGPCPKDAKVCVDTGGRRSWLQNNGQVYYTADLIGPGRPGLETPSGTFYVNRKVKDEISWEFGNAPMPYATYFTNNGIAFHQGDPSILSHGCVRMYRADAQRYFQDLAIGDKVFVY
ncbi:L,D-transpeptidase [Corynebacterium sp. NML130628]|uniref:L,D-transpeptidase n=1 Tax=Corynebacterium sp. NML130628 TaxID=1906333 RepID=UPI0008FB823D|nr:L,D-transpeptidase [Corynebacterium sp. NML130628]OIR40303.1 hypothetical protein BJP07_10170 [Corynebacterium sp. NML130628]